MRMSLKREIRKLVDPATGQEHGEIPVLTHQTAQLRDEFMFAHKKGFARLAQEDLGGTDLKVLMVYLSLLDFDNYVQLSQNDIADFLNLPRQNVNRSTRKLIDKKILLVGKKVGRNNTYILNSFFGWKGNVGEKYYKAYDQHSRLLDDNIS
jgi:CRP-like cAMP-binding protein